MSRLRQQLLKICGTSAVVLPRPNAQLLGHAIVESMQGQQLRQQEGPKGQRNSRTTQGFIRNLHANRAVASSKTNGLWVRGRVRVRVRVLGWVGLRCTVYLAGLRTGRHRFIAQQQ